MLASDASTTYGYGVSISSLVVEHVRRLARLDTKAGDHVVLGRGVPDDGVDRVGEPHKLDLGFDDFATVLAVRAPEEHINLMEGRAFLAALRWFLRSAGRHRRRLVVLIDSRVWIGAAAKGRSSSMPLLRLLRRVSALVLGSGLVVHYIYIPSKHNPADAPSRGIRGCRGKRCPRGARRRSRFEQLLECQKLAEEAMDIGVTAAHRARVIDAAGILSAARVGLLTQLRKLDKDDCGKLPVRAARRIILRFLPAVHSAVDTRELVKLAAAERDGKMDYSKFLSFLRYVSEDPEDSDGTSSHCSSDESFISLQCRVPQ